MRGIVALFRLRFMVNLQYKAAALANVFTQLFFGFVMVMVYEAFFNSTSVAMPMTFEQTVTYIWLGQGLLALIPWSGDREVQAMIRKGDVAYELVRPVNLYWFWYSRLLALRIAPMILRSIPLFLVASQLIPEELRVKPPVDLEHFLVFLLTMVGAVFLGGALSNLITISTLFTIGDGMDRFFPALVIFFSGLVVPLSFFPDWSQPIFRYLPFSGLMDTPYKLYMGIYPLDTVPFALLHQLFWTALLVVLGQWMMRKADKRIVVQGG